MNPIYLCQVIARCQQMKDTHTMTLSASVQGNSKDIFPPVSMHAIFFFFMKLMFWIYVVQFLIGARSLNLIFLLYLVIFLFKLIIFLSKLFHFIFDRKFVSIASAFVTKIVFNTIMLNKMLFIIILLIFLREGFWGLGWESWTCILCSLI